MMFFYETFLPLSRQRGQNECWKNMKTILITLSASCIAALVTGCVERRVEYVPAYQVPPTYQPGPAYTYAPQTAYQSPPAQTPDASAAAVAPQANAPSNPVVEAQTPPPAPQVEVVPVA